MQIIFNAKISRSTVS